MVMVRRARVTVSTGIRILNLATVHIFGFCRGPRPSAYTREFPKLTCVGTGPRPHRVCRQWGFRAQALVFFGRGIGVFECRHWCFCGRGIGVFECRHWCFCGRGIGVFWGREIIGMFALPSMPTTTELGTQLSEIHPPNLCSPSIDALTKFGG